MSERPIILIDGDNPANLNAAPPSDAYVVVFLNLSSAVAPSLVAKVALMEPNEVIVSDDWPESVDLAILSWIAALRTDSLIDLRSEDGGLRHAKDVGLRPAGALWRLTFGGPGTRRMEAGNYADPLAAATAILGTPGATAPRGGAGSKPWWARMADAACTATARVALPLGLSPQRLAPEFTASLQSVFSGEEAPAQLAGEWQVPEPPLPLAQAQYFAVVRAVPGLLQVRTQRGDAHGYDWVRLRRHCPEVINCAARPGFRLPVAPAVAPAPEEVATNPAFLRTPKQITAAALLLEIKSYIHQATREPRSTLTFKRLDYACFPSIKDEDPSYELQRFLKIYPGRADLPEGRRVFRILAHRSARVLRRLKSRVILRDVLLLARRRGSAWMWHPVLLRPGDRLQLARPPEMVATRSTRHPRVALACARVPGQTPDQIVAVVSEPSSLAYLAIATHWPVEVEVARALSLVLYEVRVPRQPAPC